MNKYIKPEIKITYFENTDNNMALVSGNYNAVNFNKNKNYNEVSY